MKIKFTNCKLHNYGQGVELTINGCSFSSRQPRYRAATLIKSFTYVSSSIIWYWPKGGDALWLEM